MYKCKYCKNEYKSPKSVASHTKWCKKNPNKQKPFEKVNKKGKLRTEINNRINKDPEKIRKTKETLTELYSSGELEPPSGIASTEKLEIERRKKLSEVAKQRGLGGYVKGSGRGKKGWYKGYFCDSSWELAYVIYCLEHNIDIERNTEFREYEYEGETKRYLPDFLVEGDVVEIKGYKSEEWKAKYRHNPDVKVLYKKDMKDILKYVKTKYGSNFTNLYE